MTHPNQCLVITHEDDEIVLITPSDDIVDSEWRAVALFWAINLSQAIASRQIATTVEAFAEGLPWLRDVWRARGGKYEISATVVELVKKHQSGSERFRRLKTLDPRRHSGSSVTVPGLLRSRQLTARQQENILYLLEMENGANFSVPGAGKTLTTLCIWETLRSEGKMGKLLVVCPRSAFESWQTESEESFGKIGTTEIYDGTILRTESEICLVNYEQLENHARLSYLKSWIQQNQAALVVDEAHRIKGGARSVRWAAVKSLSNQAQRVDVLTGTPMPQGPKDLTAIFSVGWPKLSKAELDERSLPRLARNTVFVRTTKGELDLPEAELRTVSQPPTPLQEEILDALKDRYIGPAFLSISDAKNMAKRGKAVMTMLAAATNPGLLVSRGFAEVEFGFAWPPRAVSENPELATLIEHYLTHEIPWKFRYAALRAKEIQALGEKVLIWSSFIGNLAALKAVLREFQPAVIYGALSHEERNIELARFRNDPSCTVMIANPQTLGEGVSLHQVCHFEIFIDRTYNAGLYLQAVDRIHRLGLPTDQETVIEILVTRGTVDERVALRLEKKVRALSAFLQDEHLVRASIPQNDEIAPEEILGLSDEDFADIASHWGLGHG